MFRLSLQSSFSSLFSLTRERLRCEADPRLTFCRDRDRDVRLSDKKYSEEVKNTYGYCHLSLVY